MKSSTELNEVSVARVVRRVVADRIALCCFLWILLFSCVVRIIFIGHAEWVPIADTRDYHVLAWNLSHGNGYKELSEVARPAYQGLTFYAYRMPGYPAMLAAVYTLFGWVPRHAMYLNLLAELWTSCCVFLVAFCLFGRKVALFSQALWSFQVLWVTALMSETVFTTLLITLAAILVMEQPLRSKGWALVYGMVGAASVFIRPVGVVVLVFPLLLRARQVRCRTGMICLLALLLPSAIGIGLWIQRNYRVLHQFVPLTTQFGPLDAPDFGIDFESFYLTLRTQGRNEAEINKALTQAILQRALADPLGAARLYVIRIRDLFGLPSLSYVEQGLIWPQRFSGSQVPTWVYAVYRRMYYQYPLVYGLALAGLILLAAQRKLWNGLTLAFVVYVMFHAVVSRGTIRYAAPLYPMLCVFAGVSLAAGWTRFVSLGRTMRMRQIQRAR